MTSDHWKCITLHQPDAFGVFHGEDRHATQHLVLAAPAFAQAPTTLAGRPSSTDLYARLQGGMRHQTTPEQEGQSVTESTVPVAPRR
jgi:hypothetical protein